MYIEEQLHLVTAAVVPQKLFERLYFVAPALLVSFGARLLVKEMSVHVFTLTIGPIIATDDTIRIYNRDEQPLKRLTQFMREAVTVE